MTDNISFRVSSSGLHGGLYRMNIVSSHVYVASMVYREMLEIPAK